jgi:hypothetical protein
MAMMDTAFQIVLETGPVKCVAPTLDAALQAARDAEIMGRITTCIRRGQEIILEGVALRRELEA